MKKTISVGLLASCMLLGNAFVLLAGGAESGQAVHHSGQASSEASKAAGHSAAAGGKVVSGAAAVPLAVSGAAGLVSGAAGITSAGAASTLAEGASSDPGQPLPIAEEAITAGPPPDQALKQDDEHKPAKQ